ncbi:hypothetical protein TRFO_28351 [Tritrichomonas foetus]|uniref:Uncharacterized protein n=1 Tax=Tritrichomonas foetus TaxID=1144522 RepID=A0A1J4K420_9EUKA|nr:hypothetical protein TRFO_28351 [Tritrichomonas foetus]|eukprot:OHT04237.1 hypothetical protein TRFO_28351 [Tritrichomonas foetus]
MNSSLHLSDLEQSRQFRYSRTPEKSFSTSFSSQKSEISAYHSQLSEIQKRTTKVQLYETKIANFERKLKEKKRHSNFSLKETLNHLDEEESKIEKLFYEIQQKQKDIKKRKIASDKTISEQKLKLLELEDESKRLTKSNEWANSTFAIRKSSNPISDAVLQMENQVAQIKMQSRNIRSKIFHYQKELLRISEAISPVRSQQYILRAKIDEALASSPKAESPIQNEMQKTVVLSVSEQFLALTKIQTQKNINKLLDRMTEIQDKKHKMTKKILTLKSQVNDSVVQSILDQASQYKEAIARRKKLENERLNSSYNAISKELEIEVERDSIREDWKEVQKQRDDAEKILNEKKELILKLEKNVVLNADIATSGPEAILDELITKIQKARYESIILKRTEALKETESRNKVDVESNISEVIENDEDFQNLMSEEQDIIHENLNNISISLDETNEEIAQLNDQLEKESEFFYQDDESEFSPEASLNFTNSIKSFSSMTNFTGSLTNTATNRFRQFIPLSPKMIVLNERIDYIQANIDKAQRKIEKKRNKVSKKEDLLNSLLNQLDLDNTKQFFMHDVFERIERSMKWLSQMTNTGLRTWRQLGSMIMPAINEWDTKVLLAALNEAQDLYVRYSLFCK